MKNNPLISIVINCYNGEKYLSEALESVLNQTYSNFEIIFWDNQSTDSSAKIVKSYNDNRIKYFYAKEFTPLGKARNLALEKCTGDWIAFLDTDDVWDNKKLELYIKAINSAKDDSISLVYSKTKIINNKGEVTSQIDKVLSGDIYLELLKNGNFIVFSSILVKSTILFSVGKINEDLNYSEDYDLLLKVCKNSKAIGIDKYLTYYRVHTGSITSTKVYNNITEEISFLESFIKKNRVPLSVKILVYINNSYTLLSLIKYLIKSKEYNKAFTVVKDNILYFILSPFSIICKKIRGI